MTTRPVACWIAALLLLTGCHDSVGPDPEDEPGTFLVRPFEVLEPTGRRLELNLSTVAIYPCANYAIVHDWELTDAALSIRITGIDRPEVCLTATGPARAKIDLSSISAGVHRVEIDALGTAISGMLTVDADRYAFEGIEGDVVVEPAILRRPPDGTIWGFVGYPVETSAPLAEQFTRDLEALGATRRPLPPGDYGHFRILEDGTIADRENHGYWFIRMFLYGYDGDLQSVHDLVKTYADDYLGAELSNIAVFGTHGEEYWGHLLARE